MAGLALVEDLLTIGSIPLGERWAGECYSASESKDWKEAYCTHIDSPVLLIRSPLRSSFASSQLTYPDDSRIRPGGLAAGLLGNHEPPSVPDGSGSGG